MFKMLKKSAIFVLAYILMSNVECEGALKSQDELLFESFVSNYSKSYRNDLSEMSLRFKVFQQSLARQKALNEAEKQLGGTARYGVNKFSDLTPEEFRRERLSPRRQLPRNRQTSNIHARRFQSVNVTRFDWRDKGVIGAIRDQHQCGSCWAFAVVETIASAFAIESQTKIEHVLSAQQVISCDVNLNEGLDGCNGGVIKTAFSTLQVLGLVLVEEDIYPFDSKNGEVFPCRGNLPDKGVLLRNFSYYEKVDVQGMAQLLAISPLTTSVNAVPWQDYQGGIIQHHCTDTYVDHAVQVVGYDATGDVPYWIVRNTWGKDWGEGGYVRIVQNNDNLCGLQDEVAVVQSAAGVNL